jgi:hypothetical protein
MITVNRGVPGSLQFLLFASQACAARVITATILLVDGRVEISTETKDDGAANQDQVWEYLKTLEFPGSSGHGGKGIEIVPDKGNPLQATLKGTIRVAIQYGGVAEVTELRLVRKSKDSSSWRIHSRDVDALAKKRK